MNTFLSRANTIFAFTLSVLAALTFGCFLTTAFNDHKKEVTIESTKAIVKNVPNYSASREKNDLGFINFDINADLNEIFNWNVKQLFVYLTAEYETSNNKINQVVLWDKIIRRGENAALDYKDLKAKYYFYDDGHGLRANKNVTLTLSWNVIPNAGTLPKVKATGQFRLEFPDEYSVSM
jgi:signal peptidase complex subunit 3